jgi:spore coat protein U-like protein
MLKQYKLIIFFLLISCSVTYAQNAEIRVTASVGKFCTIKATSLNFGLYAFKDINSRLSLTVTCTAGTVYYIGVSPASPLFMKNTSNNEVLSYSLYHSTTKAMHLGNKIGENTISGIGKGLPEIITIFSDIKSNQPVSDGQYQDKLNIILSF